VRLINVCIIIIIIIIIILETISPMTISNLELFTEMNKLDFNFVATLYDNV